MKNLMKRILLIVVVVIFCVIFGDSTPFWANNVEEQLKDMSIEDFSLTIVDDDTVQLEHNITGSGFTYSWIIDNYAYGTETSSGNFLALEENQSIEFRYEDLSAVAFQSVVVYDGYKYTSNTFYVDASGQITENTGEDTSAMIAVSGITRDVSDIVSFAYIGFIIFMVILYYVVPKSKQWWVLLGGSILFYSLSGIQYIVFIVGSSIVAYVVAKKMSETKQDIDSKIKEETDSKEKKKLKSQLQKTNRQWFSLALIGTLGVMAVIKYSSFIIGNINGIANINIPIMNLVMPVGLSFYTFMLIAYLLDVSRGKYVAEEKFAKFFLFVSFFPHVSQGPISRYNEVSPQFMKHHVFDYDNLCRGAQRILWGFFVKLVLADRIAVFVNYVYGTYSTQSWFMLVVASLAYSVQMYADFYSSMEIAIGTAQLFGITLSENFMRPYFSTTMPEFWRRWHITLGTWFKEYVFYPISISKKSMKFSVWSRKKFGANISRILSAAPPILGVWIFTGLWHGASWSFVAWGLFHGGLILLSTAFSQNVQDFLKKIGMKTESWDYKLLQMAKVFILCTIGRVFFRTGSISAALVIFKRIITFANTNGTINLNGIKLDVSDYAIIIAAFLILFAVSVVQERIGSVREQIGKANIWIRWSVWIFLVLAVLIFGVYGVGTTPVFLYEAF